MITSDLVACIAIQKPPFPFKIPVESEGSFDAVFPQPRSTSASNKTRASKPPSLSLQPGSNRWEASGKNGRIPHATSDLFCGVMIPFKYGIDPLRHVFCAYRPVADFKMKLRNSFDPGRERVFFSKKQKRTFRLSENFRRCIDLPSWKRTQSGSPFCQSCLPAIDLLSATYQTDHHGPALMTTHHVKHHVCLRDWRPFLPFVLFGVPCSLGLVEYNDTITGDGIVFLIVRLSESMYALDKGLHGYLRCATRDRIPCAP